MATITAADALHDAQIAVFRAELAVHDAKGTGLLPWIDAAHERLVAALAALAAAEAQINRAAADLPH